MCRHTYNLNITECDVEAKVNQQIYNILWLKQGIV